MRRLPMNGGDGAPRPVGGAAGPGRPQTRLRASHWWAPGLVLGLYLAGAVALTWRLWAGPAGRMQAGDQNDINLFAWFIRYSAESVAHGSLPALVSTAMNAPHGINLMWNTSLLLPGVLLSPVTLLAGPQVSLTVLLTLGFAGSAAAMFWVLRRWEVSIWPAALGGAVYGFSPALVASGVGHYHMQFAVLPPLMIDALLRILTGRGRPVRTGVWLGALTAAQLFTGEELLLDTVIAGAVIAVLVILVTPRQVPSRAAAAAAGLGTAAVAALLLAGYGLWVQFHGPLTEHGSPWKVTHFRNRAAAFVTPGGNLLLHTRADASRHGPAPGLRRGVRRVPRLAAARSAARGHHPVLGRPPDPGRRAVRRGTGDPVPGRHPGGPRGHRPRGAAALALAEPPAGAEPGAAGPAVHPGRWPGRHGPGRGPGSGADGRQPGRPRLVAPACRWPSRYWPWRR